MIRNLMMSIMLTGSIGTSVINTRNLDYVNYTIEFENQDEYTKNTYHYNDKYCYHHYKSYNTTFQHSVNVFGWLKVDENNEYITDDENYIEYWLIAIKTTQPIRTSQLQTNFYFNTNRGYQSSNGIKTSVYTITEEIYNAMMNVEWQNGNAITYQVNRCINGNEFGYNYSRIFYNDEYFVDQEFIVNIDVKLMGNNYNYLMIVNDYYPIYQDEPVNLLYPNKKQLTVLEDTMEITGQYIVNTTTQEIIDLPSLLFTELTMPFTFISQAFNLTLFPGTPYAINISNLFLSIIATLILVWILGLIIKRR